MLEVYRVVTGRFEDFMGLTIAWRNPHPVQTTQRCTRVSESDSCARYLVERLIGGAQEEAWIDSSTMEIRRGGTIPDPCADKPAISESRGTEALLIRNLEFALSSNSRPFCGCEMCKNEHS